MILEIAKHELRRQYRDGRSITLLIIMTLILVVAVLLSFRDYKLVQHQYKENLEQARINWDNQAEKDPHNAAHDGTYVIKPLHSLTMLDRGIQQYSGQVIHLGAHERKQSSLSAAKDKTGMFRFGQMTPNFVLQYLFPLLLIFLGYNAFTEEKERQTIRLLFAQGTPIRKLALGKWLALTTQMILLSLLFICIVALSYLILKNEQAITLSEWFAFFGAYFVYFLVFINLILLVSAKAKTSGISLTASLALWIVITLIVPKLSTNMAGKWHAFPTLQTFVENVNTDRQSGLNGHNFWNEAAQDFKKKVLEEYGVKTIEELPVNYSGLLLAEGEKYESEIYTKHFDLLRNQYDKQRNIYRSFGTLSPFLSVKFISMALARSDYGFQWHFEDQAEKYRITLNTALNMNIAENSKGVKNYKAGSKLWESIPHFNYQWQPTKDILTDHTAEYLILIAWIVISFGAMLLTVSKIKIV